MHEDLRIVKTKRALLDAFFTMAEEKSFEDITVNELCARAGIRRATFYKHFDDKYHFLTFMTKSLRDEFDAEIAERKLPVGYVDYFIEYMRAVILFLDKNELAISRILESEMSSTLINIIVEQNDIDTRRVLEKSALALPAPPETVAMMITGGITRIILQWLEGGKKKSTDELAEELSNILKHFFNKEPR